MGVVLTCKMGMYVPRYVKKKGFTDLIKLKKWVLSELIALKIVSLELIELGKMGAFRKSGCFFMRQSACLVFNPIMVDNYAAFFNCTPVGRASDSMMAPT